MIGKSMIYVLLRRLLFCVTGVLYVVGACESNEVSLNIVNGYQIMLDGNLEEVPGASMKYARPNPGVTATRTGLIVCGGYGGSPLKTCEAYHKKTDK